jgi:HK97 family phage portal protein
MRIFGLDITRATSGETKALTRPDGDDGRVWHRIMESFAGAWQTNTEIKIDTALSYAAVYSCVTLISSDIAKLRPRLLELDRKVWVETTNPAYSPVLRKPNHFQTRIQFFQHWIISKLTHGNTYVLKRRDNRNVVTALYILDPTRVEPLVSDAGDGEAYYRLRRDNLAKIDTEFLLLPSSEIIHDRMNALHHPLIGISPIHACGAAALHGQKIQTASTSFFGNGARPSGVLSAPGEIKPETAQRLKDYWETQFKGDNSGKIAVLGDGLEYEPMMMTASDAQLIEQLKYSAEIIASCFHVPYYMIGGPAPAYNNISALSTQYYTQCLQVLIESLEVSLDEGLGVGEKLGVDFDVRGLLRMDTPTKVLAMKEAVGGKLMTPNEGRQEFDLPPVEGGDAVLAQQQDFSIAALAKRDAQDDPFGVARPDAVALPAPTPEDIQRAIADEFAIAQRIQERMAA